MRTFHEGPANGSTTSSAEAERTSIEGETRPEVAKALELLLSLLDSTDFETRVVRIHAKKYDDKLTDIRKRCEEAIRNQLKEKKLLEERTALELLNEERTEPFTDISTAQRALKGEWPLAIRRAQTHLTETNPPVTIGEKTLSYTEADSAIRAIVEPAFEQEQAAAQAAIEEQRVRITQDFARLKEEAATRKTDPHFIAALDAWGNSPNAAGEWGHDEAGFHAGMIHFFEYRGSSEKAGRFYGKDGNLKPKQELTIDAFIAFTQELEACIKEPRPEKNSQVKKATLIGDEEGRRRLMVYTMYSLFLNAFQRPGDRMRIITAIPQDDKGYDKAVEGEINPKVDKKRLNSLGEKREKLSLEQYDS